MTIKPKVLKLGNVALTTSENVPLRIALLLWGPSWSGKTTYAATAPGKKLVISLEPDGLNAIAHRTDCYFHKIDHLSLRELFNELQSDNPLGLDDFLSSNPEVETVIFDSATALAYRALQHAVKGGYGRSRDFTPTMEAPGLAGYGARNGIVLECLTGLLKVTAKHNRHIVITTHEDDPKIDKEGIIIAITMVLGGKLVTGFGWRLSEIWHMQLIGKTRYLTVKPHGVRAQMKTRMFDYSGPARFVLNYNSEKPEDKQKDTIAAFFHQWEQSGGRKLLPPGNADEEPKK